MDLKLKVSHNIENKNVVALFGYLIKCNNQIHSFQEQIINNYLQNAGINDEQIIKKIIYDYDDAVSFDEALHLFINERLQVQLELYYYMLVAANIDGTIDCNEEEFFNKIKTAVSVIDNYDLEAKATKEAIRLRKKLKNVNAKGHTGRRANPNDNLFRIPQAEYVAAIDRCRKIAKKDYNEIMPICDRIISRGETFLPTINNAINKSKKDFHPEVVAAISNFANLFEESIINNAKEYSKQIKRKAATLEDFTIALIGETKAGKTTLRSVLTGEGYDGIGSGKQRTTRVNHVYEWNHLRIIDTPGINAGSDFEDTDKEIAKKAINESDLICYVTVTDGKFGETKEFITEILKSNKPVHILINYKNNLLDEFVFEDFIEDPNAWCSHSGKDRIDGYFEPIRRAAQQNNVESLLSCDYVFLLAAWLSEDERYSEHSKTLMRNSGLEEFLAKLKIIVTEQGSFLRSKTIIDDTIAICESWRETILYNMKPIDSCSKSLQNNREETVRKLTYEKKLFSRDVHEIIKMQFRELASTYARRFVELNYDCSRKELNSRWDQFCKNISFNEKLKNKLIHRWNTYTDTLTEILDDVFNDIKFDLQIDTKSISISKSNTAPFKEIFKFFGGGASLAGSIVLLVAGLSNPIGWILTGVGVLSGIISSFLKSKKARIQKAKDNMFEKLNKAVMSAYEKNNKTIQQDLDKKSTDAINTILATYDNLQMGLNCVNDTVKGIVSEIDTNIHNMNLLFADRIIKYVTEASVASVVDVQREFGEKIIIYTKKNAECNIDKLNGLINELIVIKEME